MFLYEFDPSSVGVLLAVVLLVDFLRGDTFGEVGGELGGDVGGEVAGLREEEREALLLVLPILFTELLLLLGVVLLGRL